MRRNVGKQARRLANGDNWPKREGSFHNSLLTHLAVYEAVGERTCRFQQAALSLLR